MKIVAGHVETAHKMEDSQYSEIKSVIIFFPLPRDSPCIYVDKYFWTMSEV